jgi:uncharacterized phiE125 gp8 family phage protein
MALCTADDVVRYAGLSDVNWDLLDVLTESASRTVEDYCCRRFCVETRDERHDVANGMDTIVLRHYPVPEVTALYDGIGSSVRLLSASEYCLDGDAGTIQLVSGYFTPGRGSVRAVYRAGYERIPAAVAQATVMIATDLYRANAGNREARAAMLPGTMPAPVADLLAPYKRRDL